MKIAVQLYSVREDAERDLLGTLKKLKAYGYDGVEFAGLYGFEGKKIREFCDQAQIIPVSAHLKFREMLSDPEKLLKQYEEIGCHYLAISSLSSEYRPGNPLFDAAPEKLIEWGQLARQRGFQLLYHNHDFEFCRIGGVPALDRIYDTVPAELLQTELDVCWIRAAGFDPDAYISKYAGRCPLIHFKDFRGDNITPVGTVFPDGVTPPRPENMEYRSLGEGTLDFHSLLKTAEKAGAEWVIVEQDQPNRYMSPLESVNSSRKQMAIRGIKMPGKKVPEKNASWLLNDIPCYTDPDAVFGKTLYPCGASVIAQGDQTYPEPQMQTVTQTTREGYENYLRCLENNGFTLSFSNEMENNIFHTYVNGDVVLYSGYYANTGNAFFIRYDRKDYALPNELSSPDINSVKKQEPMLFQYGLSMNQSGENIWNDDSKMMNCGTFDILRCSDNSLILIDGGSYHQFGEKSIENLYRFMRKITGENEESKIRISAWFITHRHVDHFSGVCRMLSKYRQYFTVERIYANYPTLTLPTQIPPANVAEAVVMADLLKEAWPSCREEKVHSGQTFQIADAKFEILHTHEDEVDFRTGESTVRSYFNATTLVIRMTVGQTSVMLLGDLAKERPENFLVMNYSDSFLKSDAVQISHHMWNHHMRIYSAVAAPVALFPQSSGGCKKDSLRREMVKNIQKYASDGCFYEGDETTGFVFGTNHLCAVTREPVQPEQYEGWPCNYKK